MLLPHGSRMSSSQNGKCLFSWILLTKRFLAYFFFRSPAAFKTFRALLAHGSHMSTSMNNKSFLCWIYFLPYIITGLIFYTLTTVRPWNRWGCCCLMGPACHPLRTKMFLFLDFLPTDFWFIFSFHPLPPLKCWRRCWLMGPRCQPPRTRNMWYLDYFVDNKHCILLWAIANG